MNELENVLLSIPESVANLQLPDPDLRDYYLDEQNRIYWVDTQIDDSTLGLVKFIIRCNKEDAGKSIEDRKRILIMIDSCSNFVNGNFDFGYNLSGKFISNKNL